MKRKFNWRENKRYLLTVISAVLVLAMLGIAAGSRLIPAKYLLVAAAGLGVVLTGLFLLQKKGGKIRFCLAVLVEILLLAGSVYGMSVFYHATNMVNRITEQVTETDAISVYVMADAPYQSIQEAADNAVFGVVKGQSGEAVMQMLYRVSKESGLEIVTTEYPDMFLAADALRTNIIQVLVLNEAYAGLIPEIEGYEWFAQETRVLESYLEEVTVETEPAAETEPDEEEPGGQADSNMESEEEGPGIKPSEQDTEHENEADGQITMELMEPPEQVDWNALVGQEMLEAPEGTFIVYISGVDTWGSASAKSRSDVNILAVVNTNTKKILLVSTPRDYYVPLSISNGVKDKLTHAGIYGIKTSVDTLELLYGVDIQYYVRMNFTGFVGIVDALGGVDVYSDSAFAVGDAFSYTEGVNHMSGIEALAFARERHSFAGGDRARGTHQMEVIKAVLRKCASSSILYNYAEVMNSMSGCFTTDMPRTKIASLVRMQLGDMAEWTITSMSVDGTGASKTTYSVPGKRAYVMIPDDNTVQSAKESIAAILNGE